jgi:hypothetical protein
MANQQEKAVIPAGPIKIRQDRRIPPLNRRIT